MSDQSSVRSSALYRVFLFLALVCVILVTIRLLNRNPQIIADRYGDTSVTVTLSPGMVLMPGEAVTMQWQAANIQAIYLDDAGTIGEGETSWTADGCTASHLRILLPDEGELNYTVYPSIGILDAPALLLITGLVICLLVAGFLYPLPLFSPAAYAIVALSCGISEPAHRMALLRAGWLFSALVMLFYAPVTLCETRSLLSFSTVYPVHVAAYMLFALASGLLLLISLIQPAAVLRSTERFLLQTPRSVMLAVVFIFWWLIFTLLAMWGYRLPVTVVLIVGFWPAAAGYVALLANAESEARRIVQIPPVLKRREIAVSGALALWLLAWYAPWQNVISDYWLRSTLALLLFLLPGLFVQQWLYGDRPLSRSLAITGGFVLSVTITVLLGLLATLLHLPHTAVIAGLVLIGGLALLALLWRGEIPPPAPDDSNPPVWTVVMLAAVIGLVLFSRLPFSYMHYEAFAGDYWTQTAYTTYYAESNAYQFHEVLLGTETATPPRMWFYFWPLTPAVIGQLSHIHTATQLKLIGPLMAALSLLCTYGLVRAFHLKRSLAWLAVLLQIMSLLLLLNPFETGQAFMQWAAIDKIVGTFILAPVLFRVLLIFLENPNRRYFVVVILAAFALPFTHAVVTALTALIVGCFLVFDGIATRRWKPQVVALIVIAIATSLPFFNLVVGSRTSEQLANTTNAETQFELAQDYHLATLSFASNGRYAINPELVDGVVFAAIALSILILLLRMRESPGARLAVASAVPVLIVLWPTTALLLGRAITPFQIWRVPWVIPLGAVLVLAYHTISSVLPRHSARWLNPLLAIVCLGVIFNTAQIQTWPSQDLSFIVNGNGNRPLNPSERLAALGAYFNDTVSETVLLIGDPNLSTWVPSLSAKTSSLIFRNPGLMANQAGISSDEAEARYDAYLTFFQSEQDDDRFDVLDTYGVDYIVLGDNNAVVTAFAERHAEQIVMVHQVAGYTIYVYQPD